MRARWLTMAQFRARYLLERQKVYRAINRGFLTAFRVGRTWHILDPGAEDYHLLIVIGHPERAFEAFPYIRREEVMKALGVGSRTIRTWREAGLLKPVYVGKHPLYRLKDLRAILDRAGTGLIGCHIRKYLETNPAPSARPASAGQPSEH